MSKREEAGAGWYWSWEADPAVALAAERDTQQRKSAFVFPGDHLTNGHGTGVPTPLWSVRCVAEPHFWVSVYLRIRMPSGSLRSQTRSNCWKGGLAKVGKVSQCVSGCKAENWHLQGLGTLNWKPKKMFICTPCKSTERGREACIIGDTWVPELILEQHVLESL